MATLYTKHQLLLFMAERPLEITNILITEGVSNYRLPREKGGHATISIQRPGAFRVELAGNSKRCQQQLQHEVGTESRILEAILKAQEHILDIPESEFDKSFREFLLTHEVKHHQQEFETGAMSLLEQINDIIYNAYRSNTGSYTDILDKMTKYGNNLLLVCEAAAWAETYAEVQGALDEDFLTSMLTIAAQMSLDTARSGYEVNSVTENMQLACHSNHVAWAFLHLYAADPYLITTLDSRFDYSTEQTSYLLQQMETMIQDPQTALESITSEDFIVKARNRVKTTVQRIKDMIEADEELADFNHS